MASIMLDGKNISNIVNFDHRLLQKYYFEGSKTPMDLVVLGSSRSMLLNSPLFQGRSFYNASIAGASIEDYLAIYQLMVNKNTRPKTLILEISPWIFNRNSGQTRWKSLRAEYLEALARLGRKADLQTWANSIDLQKYEALLSFPYLQDSLRWLSIPAEFYATQSADTGEAMKLSDGSRTYDAQDEALTPDQVRTIALESLSQPYSLSNFSELDPKILELFEKFVNSVQKDGVHVIIVLMPYQPDYFRALVSDPKYRIIETVQSYLEGFAAAHAIEIWGSYDPGDVGCDASEYYDGLHPRRSCINKLILERSASP